MKHRFSTRFELSTRSTTVLSVILGALFYAIGIYATRGAYTPGHTIFGLHIQVLAPYLSLTLLFVGIIAPWFVKLLSYIDLKLTPRPGAYALPLNVLGPLERSLNLERDKIEETTVPSHLPSARPATSSLAVHLGDATLVLPQSDHQLIQQFVGRPRNPRLNSTSSRQECEQEVLMLTGEPGGGKSVILQELHASLSLGVEKGYHSVIPLIVFARDLTLQSLLAAEVDSETPLQTLVSNQYESRCNQAPNPGDLRPLKHLISHDWDRMDLLVLFDGLDEIAQRSVYEKVQQILVRLILKDLKSGRQAVHRFVLSCRTDEDLELFRDAPKVRLRGLTTEQDRERFCQNVIAQAGATAAARRSLERALTSRRLVPDHVFRRNPYFLALLVGHLRDDEDRVKEEALDFDFLMRKYLEREAYRPYAALTGAPGGELQSRRGLFNELETVARLSLQFLSFLSASSTGTTSLYDEIAIDQDLVQAFLAEIDRAEGTAEETCWTALSRLLDELVRDPERVSSEALQRVVLAGHLHENDVRVLLELAQRTRGNLGSDEPIFAAFGFVPFRQLLEEESWYRTVARQIYSAVAGATLTPRHTLGVLVFARSLVAAQVLRIIWMTSHAEVSVRFRHRRLAEYYAACFLRNRWRDLDQLLFTPWLAPILNLTCAIEGPRCYAVRWLVDRIARVPTQPRYEWRYGLEAAVEAAFFAQPGDEYSNCVRDLVCLLLETLHHHGLHSESQDSQARLDLVTELTFVRAIDTLSRLRPWTGVLHVQDHVIDGFREYEKHQPAEWITEFAVASRGVTVLTGQRASFWSRLGMLWKLVQQPSSILGAHWWRQPGMRLTWLGVMLSVVLGEVVLFGAFVGAVIVVLRPLAEGSVSQSEIDAAMSSLVMLASVPWLVIRIQAWMRSRSRAAFWSSATWRLVPAIKRGLKAAARPGLFVPRVVRVLFESAWQQGLALGLSLLLVAGAGVVSLWLTDVSWFEDHIPAGQPTQAKFDSPGERAGDTPADNSGNKLAKAPERRPEPRPCQDIDSRVGRLLASFDALPPGVSPDRVTAVRRNLSTELAELRKANLKNRCGNQTEEGWVLAEERAADLLFERDDRLIPVPEPSQANAFSESNARRFAQLVRAVTPAEPPSGAIGSVLLFRTRQEVAQTLKEIKDLRRQAIESRRNGAVGQLSRAAKEQAGLASINALMEAADSRLNELTNLQAKLEGRGTASIMWLVVGGIPVLLILSVGIRQFWKFCTDRTLAKISSAPIPALSQHLEKQTYSESIRRGIIRVMANRENITSADLAAIEQTGERLYGSRSITDKELAVGLADLAIAFSKRLRHRMTVDAPVKTTAQSSAGRAGK